jgi:hypothetical protein
MTPALKEGVFGLACGFWIVGYWIETKWLQGCVPDYDYLRCFGHGKGLLFLLT